ncbi:hypothetical protein [Bradyrhizobium centrolobii]
MQSLALTVQESLKRDPDWRSLHRSELPRRSSQYPLARWDRTVALRQTS